MDNLQKLIEQRGLDQKEVAALLFPANKYANNSLRRVMIGEQELKPRQKEKLAALAGVSLSELDNKEWSMRSKGHIITFDHQDYKAELNTKTWATTLFHKKSLLFKEIIHDRTIPLSNYIDKLNSYIF